MFVGYATNKGLFTLDWEAKKDRVQVCSVGEANQFAGDVCQIQATPDCRFVLVGVPSTNSFCVFTYDRTKNLLSL